LLVALSWGLSWEVPHSWQERLVLCSANPPVVLSGEAEAQGLSLKTHAEECADCMPHQVLQCLTVATTAPAGPPSLSNRQEPRLQGRACHPSSSRCCSAMPWAAIQDDVWLLQNAAAASQRWVWMPSAVMLSVTQQGSDDACPNLEDTSQLDCRFAGQT